MPDRPLYVFDGYNLLHEAGLDDARALVDRLAGFVALRGARGVVVFDGVGEERTIGALDVRFAEHADDLIERLAAEHRATREVVVVTSDRAILGTAGQESRRVSSKSFLRELEGDERARGSGDEAPRSRVGDALAPEVRNRLEWWRRQRR